MDLRDSWLRCVRCGKRMAIWPGEEEGQGNVTHVCLHCPEYSVRAPAERPQRSGGAPFLAGLRQRMWEAMP